MGVLTRVGAERDLPLTQLRVLGILRDVDVSITPAGLELAERLKEQLRNGPPRPTATRSAPAVARAGRNPDLRAALIIAADPPSASTAPTPA
ncbi:hypothetical protein ACFO1B_52115 [Dactylosporangium siamense]|uniref:Uncharacterized protein n=1 Tax=Dactylosporangium siamense TaxID=685454 RepID=A0A919UHL8_9ACTN|nr:hypothetical protein [Dactylosporangium siamense]GIG52526.1 hypothetical protein Dsi01nite_105670 [Dactylosporangium siamense]